MRLLPALAALAALAMTACTARAEDPTGVEWALVAIDGQVVDFPASLSLDSAGDVAGRAPCNSYGGQNQATLPDLSLPALRATRMACDRLAEEQTYFTALSAMTRLERVSAATLVLTGADGRSMEFARGPTDSRPNCTTCASED